MDGDEKLLTLSRTGLDAGNKRVEYAATGYGPYSSYSHPPMWHYMAGGLMTYWLMRSAFRPYYTPMSRYSTIRQRRTTYRRSPAYKTQLSKTKSFNKSGSRTFSKTPSKSTSGSRWGNKSSGSGSWGSGSKKASTSTSRPSTSKSSSGSRSWGSSSSTRKSSGTRRSFGSSRRRR